jgi:chloramphenicol 3-O phosphotransferase
MHATVAALADAGLNVIVDHVILERRWVDEMARLWATFDVLAVGVRCPLEIVLEREREREDRTLGQAEAQFEVVHRWTTYHVEVDTSVLTPGEAVSRIVEELEQHHAAPVSGSTTRRRASRP